MALVSLMSCEETATQCLGMMLCWLMMLAETSRFVVNYCHMQDSSHANEQSGQQPMGFEGMPLALSHCKMNSHRAGKKRLIGRSFIVYKSEKSERETGVDVSTAASVLTNQP